jgi:minor extracellular serine protease Vpr
MRPDRGEGLDKWGGEDILKKGMLLALVALATVGVLGASASAGDFTESVAANQTQSEYLIVTLKDPASASYTGGIPGLERTKPERGQKLNTRGKAVQAYARYLGKSHQAYRDYLASNAPNAQVVREYFHVLNGFAIKLNGTRTETAAAGPGVGNAVFSWLYRPTMTVSTDLIDADLVWPSAGGRANAGSGINIGIIDTGIREDHPAFGCKGPIAHDVFASGGALPPGAAETIVFNHGTHVSGTAAGCILDLSGPEDGPTSGTWSGVAPGASLHDYNVFPGFGAGFRAFGGSAFSHDICAALEKSVVDGMDVVNMSIGGGVQGPHDTLAECTDATADAGVVPAVAAGNEGPGDSTISSPGSAPGALTAGASTNPHFVGIPATVASKGTFGAALGDFANFDPPITAGYTVTTPANGCTAISTALAGKIALIDRGVCTFSTKIRNAQTAGAVGVLIVNNVAGDPVGMAQDGTANQPTIPAAMLGKADGNAIKPSGSVTVDGTAAAEFITANADIIAGFSSRGPTPFTFLIKPDVTAPGVNVYSSVFNEEEPSELGFAYFQGTSMATPHVAGSAALLLDLHPGWSPADVKSALAQTAKRPVWDHINGTTPTGVLVRGGGRIDLDAATATPLTISPASASFGLVNGNKAATATQSLAVRNVSSSGQLCSAATTGPSIVSVSPTAFSVATGGTTSLTLTLDGGKAGTSSSGDYSGDVAIACGSTTLRVPWFVRITRQGKP